MLALDSNGDSIAAWLEPQPDAIWLVRYSQLPADLTGLSAANLPELEILGLIQPGAGRVIESSALGTDAAYGYMLWGDVSVSGPPDGSVYALTFPLDKPETTRQITIAQNARWPDTPNAPPIHSTGSTASPLAVGLTFSTDAGDQAAVLWLNSGQIQHVDRFPMFDRADTTGMVALAQSAAGQIVAVWAVLHANATTNLYMVESSDTTK